MANRPGIMLYFDLTEPLVSLSYADKGRLLEAMLQYGQFGEQPEFEGMLKMAWSFIRPKLDKDAANYADKILKSTYSSFCAKLKRQNPNATPPDFEDWLSSQQQSESNGTERPPTPTTSSPTATSADKKAGTTQRGDRGGKGEEETSPSWDFETRKGMFLEQLRALPLD